MFLAVMVLGILQPRDFATFPLGGAKGTRLKMPVICQAIVYEKLFF